ncbi:mycothiol transferase [Actinomarinicola tropica]|uniref:DUF664 domain-containing protein n=1 Tax=Actinomarinicola tropica TaxID=2789776 RepID=A0A5Q2RPM2_9ACTN|nr:DUF664 domain-containing protein [Actinomarinicola tropica]QGG96067.1 DUF664 domain-containing protein [Actinomarinicola tropica]
MDATEVLVDLYGRLPELVHRAVDGLRPDQLVEAPREGANTIGWLVWHLTRVQDAQVADVAGAKQLWVSDGWAKRFGRSPDPADHGYGHTPEQVASIRPESAELLVEHFEAVHERTMNYVWLLTADDLDRVVDEDWNPPVTLGVRLVSIADDCLQHAGQAAYARGLIEGPGR